MIPIGRPLRVKAGFPWFGADMNAESLPLEARQDAAISMDKGCYMGQATVSRIVFRGRVNKILMGIRFAGEAAPVGLGIIRYDDAVAGAKVSTDGRDGELFVFNSWPKPLSRP